MKNKGKVSKWLDAQHHHGATAQRVVEQSALLAVVALVDMAATTMVRICPRPHPHLTPLRRGVAAAVPAV